MLCRRTTCDIFSFFSFLSLVCFPLTEELVLEESPKWRLVSEVLAEIERDDADNDKCTCYTYCLYFVWLSVIFTSINDFKLLLRLKRSYRRSLSIPIFFLGKECRAKYFLPMFKTGQCFKLWKDEEKILFRRSLSNALRITYIFNCLWKKYLISEALQFDISVNIFSFLNRKAAKINLKLIFHARDLCLISLCTLQIWCWEKTRGIFENQETLCRIVIDSLYRRLVLDSGVISKLLFCCLSLPEIRGSVNFLSVTSA